MENQIIECPFCGTNNNVTAKVCACGYYFDLDEYKEREVIPLIIHPVTSVRLTASMIDCVLAFIFASLIYSLYTLFTLSDGNLNSGEVLINFNAITILKHPIGAISWFLYFSVQEGNFSNRTIGKRMLKLKVLKTDFSRIDYGDALLRHICRSSLFWLYPICFFRKDSKTIYDIVSKTQVVNDTQEHTRLYKKEWERAHG
jgi:uncharacterized RDD family membrane protein YckC